VWVAYIAIYVGTIFKRREPHIYVANWFYLAFMLTIAVLHIVNNLAVPVSIFSSKSYSLSAGVQDALIQWWYGHNAVGFFLTAGFLGMMYYYLPKQADRPIYSYRLSVVHFWTLIFLYIWAGPHHLHYTALPDWAQTLGMVFSVMLWMPSWGGMINGLMTLSGAWDKLRTDPALRFSVTAVGFYGMATFEGPVMSIRQVNGLSHYTDWTIGHVHSGALGWVAFMTFGAFYYLVPVLWKRDGLYSKRLVAYHYWIATLGIVFYIVSMWVAGILQGLMWRAYDDQGFLQYSFVETVAALHPFYIARAIGGALFIIGALIITYVTFGGMKATTWVQIIKAGPLLGGATLMAIGVMVAQAHHGDRDGGGGPRVEPTAPTVVGVLVTFRGRRRRPLVLPLRQGPLPFGFPLAQVLRTGGRYRRRRLGRVGQEGPLFPLR
jgi:cytochrome c oxidase cbb3-type subunit 1